ncbi:fimbria/pilus outer membrane usher protein [Oxalobacteraceae bacterium R-40]|uniref:Fimbria/pilus outer membrane usher protein n=1 Tax=Keguizhuia sedimenti TaxID=3064264 RepID=A0ABU1BRH2_9BURK|nr:fimbria/pilus outer membrane usher protein [Oxalobacteraceae bacterium R-40]
MRPYEVPFGLPILASQAAVPSNVDVYVNGVLQTRRAVPYGPFEITDIPATSGAGQISAVIKDSEGNEKRISLPYYVSAGLLKGGAHEYHAELGFPRKYSYGDSDKYGKAFAAYGHRYGLTSGLTAGARVEAQGESQAAGIDVNQRIFEGMILETSVATSRSDAGTGYTGALALEKASTDYSVRLSAQTLSSNFRQLGLPDNALADRLRLLGSLSFSPTGLDALTLSHSVIKRVDGREDKTSQLYYRLPSVGAWNTSLFYSKFHSDGGNQYFGIQFSYMLDSNHYVNAGVSRQTGQEAAVTTDYSRTAPSGNGYGYRLSAVRRGDEQVSANAALQIKSELTSYSLDAGQNGRNSFYRVGMKGSMAGVGSDLLWAREIQDSFAVVKVGNFPNVRVLHENQPVARTNEHGVALIPSLRAYEVNKIGFVEADLPLTVSVENTQKAVAPRYRSGTYIHFPVKTDKHVFVKVVHPEFKRMPFGSLAVIEGMDEKFSLASNGELYLPNLERPVTIKVSYKNQHCSFSLNLPKTENALTRLGVANCR